MNPVASMSSVEILEGYRQLVAPTYPAPTLAIARGRGARVWDPEGRSYLDFTAGVAVSCLGHAHPSLTRALRRQAARTIHVSNLFAHEGQVQLGRALVDRSIGGKVFFCNSGAEANEALIKLARLWGSTRGRSEMVTMRGSFHGRTLATLTATGQEKVQKGFHPLPTGFRYATFNDLESCRAVVNEQTAAVLVEAIQGEAGVVPAQPGFLEGLEALCRERGALLFVDEVQCGMGRTGKWFGYQHHDIRPDALSLAKGLGGGFPMGAVVMGPALGDVFQPGTHGSTFGGTPLACAAGLAVIETIEQQGLLDRAAALGAFLAERLCDSACRSPAVREVRGRGLMIGLVLDRPTGPVQDALRDAGLLAIATAGNVIRLLPPLTVSEAQIRSAARCIDICVRALPAVP